MSGHVSDLACLEWLRSKAFRFAPEDPAAFEAHVAECQECARKLDGFRQMLFGVHPYGSPLPAPWLPKFARRAALVVAVLCVALLVIRLVS